MATFKDLQKAYGDQFETFDEEQEERLEKIKMCVYREIGAWNTYSDTFIVSRREGRVHRRRRGQQRVCVIFWAFGCDTNSHLESKQFKGKKRS